MKQLKAFARLTGRDQRLLLEAFITLAICRVRLRAHNIEKLRAWATHAEYRICTVARLTWAVEVVSRRMPRTSCLCRALALQRLLAKYGHSSELRIGVEKDNGQFGAHAWLIHGGEVLIGASEDGKYELLTAWQSKVDPAENRGQSAARL